MLEYVFLKVVCATRNHLVTCAPSGQPINLICRFLRDAGFLVRYGTPHHVLKMLKIITNTLIAHIGESNGARIMNPYYSDKWVII